MGRPRTVDRERLLQVAEEVASAGGAAGLSLGKVATAAGIPKATVQSVFGTREGLIEAMLERWIRDEAERFAANGGGQPSAKERVRAHVLTTEAEPTDISSRVAALFAVLASSGDQQPKITADWYAGRIGSLEAETDDERRLRLAFLATEGAFFIRHLAGLEMSEAVWGSIFADIKRLTS